MTKGFVDYRIKHVVKFGGSLLSLKDRCRSTIETLVSLANNNHRILVIPGGGPTDKTIEAIDKWANLHPDTHHTACALAQDQTGLILSDPSFSKQVRACTDLESVSIALEESLLAILLPSKIIFALNPFERSWEITSDSMAAWFAWLVRCNEVIVLTDVDGIYRDGAINNANAFIPELTAFELSSMGHTSVDACFAPFILQNNINAWILNGAFPERIAAVFNGDIPIGTRIWGGK